MRTLHCQAAYFDHPHAAINFVEASAFVRWRKLLRCVLRCIEDLLRCACEVEAVHVWLRLPLKKSKPAPAFMLYH
jgi:hypothetical protein